jgi:hypothetical protein
MQDLHKTPATLEREQIIREAAAPVSAERWIRIPSKGYCPNTGLSRSHLFALIAEGEIKSRSLKKPGNTRGPRLVWLPSVFDYIERAGVE